MTSLGAGVDGPLRVPEPAYLPGPPQASAARSSRVANKLRTSHSLSKRERDNARSNLGHHHALINISTPEDLEDPFLKYFKTQSVEHGEDTSCIFLLWNSLPASRSKPCSLMEAEDIPIKGTEMITSGNKHEDKIFRRIRRVFYERKNSWASYLGMRVVSAVRPIKFRLIKLHGSGFLVSPLATDGLPENREKCRASMAEIDEQLEEYNDLGDSCYPDPDNDEVFRHIHARCEFTDHRLARDAVCLFQEWSDSKRRMDWIDTTPFLTFYFLHPDAAKDQNILSSRFSEDFFHHYRSIRFWHGGEHRSLVLTGLYVEEQWKTHRVIPLVIITLLAMLLVIRSIWKSWEVVFGAASFIVAAIMLVLSIHDGGVVATEGEGSGF